MDCEHQWRQVYEEFLMGGMFPDGWECLRCGKFVSQNAVPPTGLGGVIVEGAKLVGPHGGQGNTSDGRRYKEQIVHPDGRLEVIYAD